MFENSPFSSFFLLKISILVKTYKSLDFSQNFSKPWFWSIFSKKSRFDQNYRKISIFVKIYENLNFSKKFRLI